MFLRSFKANATYFLFLSSRCKEFLKTLKVFQYYTIVYLNELNDERNVNISHLHL